MAIGSWQWHLASCQRGRPPLNMFVSVQRRVAPQLNFCTTQCDDYSDNLAGILGLPNFVQFSPRIPFVSPHLLLILFKFASTSPFRCSRGSIPNRVIRVLRPQANKASPSSYGSFWQPPDNRRTTGRRQYAKQSQRRAASRHIEPGSDVTIQGRHGSKNTDVSITKNYPSWLHSDPTVHHPES